MVRRHSLRYLLVLALSLVMTAGMVAPAIAESENDTVVVTAQVLPYLEVSISPTSINFGNLPSVWDTGAWPTSGGNWYADDPLTVTVTSNLAYSTTVAGSYTPAGLLFGTHFSVYLTTSTGTPFLVAPGTSVNGGIAGGPGLNTAHTSSVFLSLNKNSMPLPPGTISYNLMFTVSQVI
jgi:hypothetical protein